MKLKRKYFFLLLFFNIFSLHVHNGQSWSNGSYSYNSTNYDINTDFGTHDWISERALDVLLLSNSSKWEWLENRKTIFFVGTEAPDNVNVDMILNDIQVQGFGDFSYHHVYFNEDGTIKNNEDDAALRAKWCFDMADVYLNEEKLDIAAFYLGAMTHYIVDCSMYAHVAENYVPPYNINFDEFHSIVESRVHARINDYDNKEDFFQFSNVNILKMSAYDATIELGWDTYKDSNPTENFNRDAFWLHTNFFSSWDLTYSERIIETNQTKIFYYDRIEENLNNAIEKCVAVLNNINIHVDERFIFIMSYNLLIFIITSLSIMGIIITIKRKKLLICNIF